MKLVALDKSFKNSEVKIFNGDVLKFNNAGIAEVEDNSLGKEIVKHYEGMICEEGKQPKIEPVKQPIQTQPDISMIKKVEELEIKVKELESEKEDLKKQIGNSGIEIPVDSLELFYDLAKKGKKALLQICEDTQLPKEEYQELGEKDLFVYLAKRV
jgi:hypothetical protein